MLLWFDVENGRYTTEDEVMSFNHSLWFDVEDGRYTTNRASRLVESALWFDVENGRYTTFGLLVMSQVSCGLM